MKILFRAILVLWMAAGLGMGIYFTRVATPAAEREVQRLTQGSQTAAERDAAFRQTGHIWGDLKARQVRFVAAWGLVGFLLALRGVNLLFQRADLVGDVDRFLAGSRPTAAGR